jgi:hypothetical protein
MSIEACKLQLLPLPRLLLQYSQGSYDGGVGDGVLYLPKNWRLRLLLLQLHLLLIHHLMEVTQTLKVEEVEVTYRLRG